MFNQNISLMTKIILRAIFSLALISVFFWGAGELLASNDFASSIVNREINIYLLASVLSLFLVINFFSKVKRIKIILPNILSIASIVILLVAVSLPILSEVGYYSGKMAGDVIFFVILVISGLIPLLYKFKLEGDI